MGHPHLTPDGLGRWIGLAPDVPTLERWGREVRHHLRWGLLVVRNRGRRPPAVVAWPHLPSRRSVLHRVCAANGWELTNRPRKRAILHIRFEDATEKATPLPAWFTSARVPVLNAECTDIRKSTLERLHVEVFGYGLAVDPTAHFGAMLEKGDGNALHDGRIVTGPWHEHAVQPDKVYQHVIENTDPAGRRFDLRVGYVSGEFPVVYAKFKLTERPFANETSAVEVRKMNAEFTAIELRMMRELLQRMGTDCAELDVLRDASSGRMYVVDVNPTPWGPPAGLGEPERSEAIAACARAYARVCEAAGASIQSRRAV